jgi:hypothetical protein
VDFPILQLSPNNKDKWKQCTQIALISTTIARKETKQEYEHETR